MSSLKHNFKEERGVLLFWMSSCCCRIEQQKNEFRCDELDCFRLFYKRHGSLKNGMNEGQYGSVRFSSVSIADDEPTACSYKVLSIEVKKRSTVLVFVY